MKKILLSLLLFASFLITPAYVMADTSIQEESIVFKYDFGYSIFSKI